MTAAAHRAIHHMLLDRNMHQKPCFIKQWKLGKWIIFLYLEIPKMKPKACGNFIRLIVAYAFVHYGDHIPGNLCDE